LFTTSAHRTSRIIASRSMASPNRGPPSELQKALNLQLVPGPGASEIRWPP